MRDIQLVLERWGGWAASEGAGVNYSSIAAGFKGLLLQTMPSRAACSDGDGLIIDGCLARLRLKKPYEYRLLVDHYLCGLSKRKIAKLNRKDERMIRIEIQMAEGFIEGCLSMLDVVLDMDC
ncbi:antitermination protein Q [Erwinia billingiae]|uniref:antiterminator Q family protein n=1 Tax=Erwinia billingiae TaxID=182337 RepID=UPI001247B800|nr:antiterminator Q family protein [Erwinia billingiae]QEW32001.1 antitermination protein Q [Erwinia billingiae]